MVGVKREQTRTLLYWVFDEEIKQVATKIDLLSLCPSVFCRELRVLALHLIGRSHLVGRWLVIYTGAAPGGNLVN